MDERIQNFTTEPDFVWKDQAPEGLDLYLIKIPDVPDSNRLAVRDAHLRGAVIAQKNGWFVHGGALLTPQPGSSTPKMTGSWVILRGSTPESALEMLSRDVYGWKESRAWDLTKAEVQQIAIAI